MNDPKNEKTRRFSLRGGFLVALGAIAVAGLMQGCGGGGGGGGPVCDDGAISTSWDLVQNGQQVACLQDDTVVVRVDDNTMTQPFDCSLMAGTTPPVEGGVSHTVDLTLFDGGGNKLSQTSPLTILVPCGTVATTPIADLAVQ
jgi:hypothetical protein